MFCYVMYVRIIALGPHMFNGLQIFLQCQHENICSMLLSHIKVSMQVNGLPDNNTKSVLVYCPTPRNDKKGDLKKSCNSL